MEADQRCLHKRRQRVKNDEHPRRDFVKHPSGKVREKVPQILDVLREMQGQCKRTLSLHNSRKAANFTRALTIHPSYSFAPVAEFVSSRHIHYDQNNIYGKNLQSVFAVGCYSVAARSSFLPAPFRHNVSEYLYMQAPLDKNCEQCKKQHCCQPSFLVLSTDNDLRKLIVIHFGATSGYIRHYVLDVDRHYKSAKMQWNVAYESFSVYVNVNNERIFKSFIFKVFPLAYQGCIVVGKDLDGRRSGLIKQASISLNMLILHEGQNTIKLYNIHGSLLTMDSEVIKISSFEDLLAPLLVVNKCEDFSMQIGGFPFRLLTGRRNGGHDIRTLEGEHYASLETLDVNSVLEDTVMFSETESGHIIQRGEYSITIFKIPEERSSVDQLQPAHPTVGFDYTPQLTHSSTSAYGRELKRVSYREVSSTRQPTILCDLDLEDELDLFYTLTCDHLIEPPPIYVNILDSETLTLLKSVQLDFDVHWNLNVAYTALFEMTVSADRDLLVVHWHVHSRYFMRVYQLHRKGIAAPCRLSRHKL